MTPGGLWRLAVRLAPVPLAAATLGSQMPLITRLTTLQNAPGVEWRRIDTPHFTVIYPDSLAAGARRVAALLENAYGPLGSSLRAAPERIPVVLNNQSLTSNGYVAWGPRRSQWYSMPPTTVDGMGPLDWYTLLALHEGRHVVQERLVRTGWVGLFSRVFGENTTAFLGGTLYYPSWWWEGDAVGTETALSQAGRGRQPSFTARTRALAAAGARLDYYATWQGSFRTLYPDWYEQGYVLTTFVRRHHGDSAWARAVGRARWNPFAPFALGAALRRQGGSSLTGLQRRAVAELDSVWREERSAIRETAATKLSPATSAYHAWAVPQYASDGSVIAVYGDLDTPPQLVRLRGGRREVLVARSGITGDLQFHVRGNRVVWSEYEVDPRYGERNYLVVKALDLATGKVTRLTDRSRYYGPTLSPDGTRIAAIHFSPARLASLVILDAVTGAEVRRVPNDVSRHLVTPAWSADGRSVLVVVVDTARGNSLVDIALESGTERTIIDYTFDAISRPVAAGRWILFGSPRSGLDNVWAVDPESGARYQVSSRLFGAYTPAPSSDGSRMLFADYTPSGIDVVEQVLDPATWVPADSGTAGPFNYAEPLVEQERSLEERRMRDRVGTAATAAWPDRAYRGPGRWFDFHSVSLAPTSDGINTGLMLESRNLLNTLGVSVGGVFNADEGTAALEVGASHAAWPVLIDAAARVGSRASTFTDTSGVARGFSWRERSITGSLRLPRTRVMGLSRQSLTLAVGAGVTKISEQPVAFRFENNNGVFAPVSYGLQASHVRAGAYRDLFPTGAVVGATFRHTPLADDYRSRVMSLRGAVYLPGPVANQALVIDGGIEAQRPDNYRFAREVLFPRGFAGRYHDQLLRAGATLHAPLWYPDLAVGPLVYARRVQGAVFSDYGRGSARGGGRVVNYRSAGLELTADLAFLGTRSTTRLGVRWSKRLTGDKATVSELVLLLPQ